MLRNGWIPLALFGAAWILSACQGAPKDGADGAAAAVEVLKDAVERPDGSAVAGAPMGEHPVVALGDVLESPSDYAGRVVRLRAHIDEVCQSSGCWMIVSDDGHESRVTFKDYGFFVPKDAAGRTVEMDVEVESTTMSVEEARHYASETQGGDPESITEPIATVAIVATGVRILPASAP